LSVGRDSSGGKATRYGLDGPEIEPRWDVDGRIILRRIIMKWDVGVWTGLSWLRIETGGGHL
jgi:hypothetical protein